MVQIPHDFLAEELLPSVILPPAGCYGAGMVFLPRDPQVRLLCEGHFERVLREEGVSLLGWREIPVDETACGRSGRASRPAICQVFLRRGGFSREVFERKLLVIRKRVQREIAASGLPGAAAFYVCSLSSRTMVYKGQLLGSRLDVFYPELRDPRFHSGLALVHERYSTNTFPQWKLAHPYRYLAHNGEINTIRGNVNWMNAREGSMCSRALGEDFAKVLPVVEEGGSDSSSLDNVFELFLAGGLSPESALMTLIPQAWQGDELMGPALRAFYEYNARMMEPWDGPAAILFSDGVVAGAISDRNGLRPLRYVVTDGEEVIMSSEAGVTDLGPERIVRSGILRPGTMILVDTGKGRLREDREIKEAAARQEDFRSWVETNRRNLSDFDGLGQERIMHPNLLAVRKRIFGIDREEVARELLPTAEGEEPIGSMGYDGPPAILARGSVPLFDYFRQSFAQVTNPPMDPIRERTVMSLVQYLGGHGERLDRFETERPHPYLELRSPLLDNGGMANLRNLDSEGFRARVLPMTFQPDGGPGELERSLDTLCERAERSARRGDTILVLSDRNIGLYAAPVPSLLALGAVHHHLVREKLRTRLDLIVEAGDARNVMHLALLIGFGAKAVNPYMAFECLREAGGSRAVPEGADLEALWGGYARAMDLGLLKVMARMGISTLQSYQGAQIFEILGLDRDVVRRCFPGTPSRLGGIGFEEIAREALIRHRAAYEDSPRPVSPRLRRADEEHLFTPALAKLLREACREGDYGRFREYADQVGRRQRGFVLRGLLRLRPGDSISLEEVEPETEILRRFTTGAVSVGSISPECHETLALAMNRLRAKSNSGEGGEDPARNEPCGEDSRRSATRQVASGRFGVTLSYLVHAEELQIKMAQGAKPGEGGHLPGSKVTREIARIRNTEPGTSLISPPPHHDIYSIEDLAQLIYDLRNVNSRARINVKLACRAGIGAIAAGVAKARADAIALCSQDGGTGAAPLSSMKYVGLPWEIGLAEAQQTLRLNDLRGRVTLQVEGRMMTGRDVVVAALLGAEEFGFTTASLAVAGCLLCRQCHRNRCPVGIATQDPDLRTRFEGKPEDLETFFRFLARQVRGIMAELGFRRFEDLVGHGECLEPLPDLTGKEALLDLTPLLRTPDLPSRIARRSAGFRPIHLEGILDEELISAAEARLEKRTESERTFRVGNADRSVGARLSGYLERRGLLPLDKPLTFSFRGIAGQSFGAFCAPGVVLRLEGAANDYLGKGLSGGILAVFPPKGSVPDPGRNAIAGNTLLYGATSGEAYLMGSCGERFAVRNSGARAVVEGVGNHACEYMTGGVVVILGETGRNFGAGMNGGVAFVLDEGGTFEARCHGESVLTEKLEEPEDEALLLGLLRKHRDLTGSAAAEDLLANWAERREFFRKVLSRYHPSNPGRAE
jgi:glutamate synthase (NADPH/NADH) large chain